MAMNLSDLASTFKSLHTPGDPVILANVYDTISAEAVAGLPSCTALATASYAVAKANAISDDDLTLETNLVAVRAIGKVATKYGKPLTVDIQDGYGSQLENAINEIIEAGAVGVNLEDFDRERNTFFDLDEATQRIKTVLTVAETKGITDFVVNARCDVLVHGGSLEETVARGRRYLAAGATSVFVWGGSNRGISKSEVQELVKSFHGRLNVSYKLGSPDGLSVQELVQLGVCRISVGPLIQFAATDRFTEVAKELMESK